MIFSAGLGTRFRPWTDHHPKALALVNGKSLLERNIRYLQQQGIRDVVVNVHHFADQVAGAIRQSGGWGSRVQLSDESNELLETGGGLLHAMPFFEKDRRFATVNVDILTDLDIGKLLRFHEEKQALVSFGVMDRKTWRYLLFDNTGRMIGWRNTRTGEEKMATPVERTPQLKAYSCVAVFEYRIFDLMKERGFEGKFSLIDLYLDLARDHAIYGYDHTGDRFVDVGKPESVATAEKLFP